MISPHAAPFHHEPKRSTASLSVAAFLAHHAVDLVFDAGANAGQFGVELIAGGYRGAIHSFEPDPEPFAALARRAAAHPLWTAENTALGAAPGELKLRVSELNLFSSFLATTPHAEAFDSRSATVREIAVPVRRLDEWSPLAEGKHLFLKVDTQGFEREVLAGAGSLLAQAVGVMLELPIVHLYEGVWTIEEALSQMRAYGFVPAQFHPVNARLDDPTALLEVDCVFRRA